MVFKNKTISLSPSPPVKERPKFGAVNDAEDTQL